MKATGAQRNVNDRNVTVDVSLSLRVQQLNKTSLTIKRILKLSTLGVQIGKRCGRRLEPDELFPEFPHPYLFGLLLDLTILSVLTTSRFVLLHTV